jgi:hypothetical protein
VAARDRLIGLLTERAARTLLYYLSETNLNVYHWFLCYLKENPIPRVRLCMLGRSSDVRSACGWQPERLCGLQNGHWDDVSGESFLRKLLSQTIEEAKFNTVRFQHLQGFAAVRQHSMRTLLLLAPLHAASAGRLTG